MRDRRFVGHGFKRQVPVGPHITDFVSFPLRVVIELVPADEVAAAVATRARAAGWLTERGYRVCRRGDGRCRGGYRAKVLDGSRLTACAVSPSAS